MFNYTFIEKSLRSLDVSKGFWLFADVLRVLYPIQNANAEGLFRAEVIYPYTKGSYTVMAKISSNFLSESISHIILQAYH